MAILPPMYLDCVVAIGAEDEQGAKQWIGSGFIYGDFVGNASADEKNYRVYVATNRHVIAGQEKFYLRFNPEDSQPAREYAFPLVDPGSGRPTWYGHPDAGIDVVIVPINGNVLQQHRIKFALFASDEQVLDCAGARACGISEGDGVFVLGFPMGLVGGDRNFVIVRQGAIARIRDTLAGGTREFLVDVPVFPGNSGGPVVTRPEVVAIQGTKPQQMSRLLGMVKAYIPYQDVALSAQTRRPRVIFEENSGLTAVIPMDFIKEAIQEHLKAVKRKEPAASTTNTVQVETAGGPA